MAESDGSKRSIDERLDALTMNVELMSHASEAHDRRIEQLAKTVEQLADSVQKLVSVSNQDATAIRTLARIAEVHESRIDNLEGGHRA